jgi:hypothetical protein
MEWWWWGGGDSLRPETQLTVVTALGIITEVTNPEPGPGHA